MSSTSPAIAPMRRPAARVVRYAALCLLLAVAACGARREYYVADLDVRQRGWDTLDVHVTFAWRTAVGKAHRFVPEEVTVHVFDADYRTLYDGPPAAIPIPDRQLGDRERLLVEVCGRSEGRQICLQQSEHASPKRVLVEQEIAYPLEGDYDRGAYDLGFKVERRRFASDGWEAVVPTPDVRGYLLARVENAEMEPVRIPFEGPRGRFDLRRYGHYQDFKYHVDSRLLDGEAAEVQFDVYAGLGERATRLASVRKHVTVKTRAERSGQVRHYVEQAAARIIEMLDDRTELGRAVAYVDEWSYETVSQSYKVSMAVEWRGSFFGRRRFDVEGRLEVKADGTRAQFFLQSANARALERWKERVGADVVTLDALDPLPPEEPGSGPDPASGDLSDAP